MKEKRRRKKRLDWRPPLNKLLDPIFDPVPKSSKKRWGADASEIYYGSESSDFRKWKNFHYREYVVPYLLVPLGFLLVFVLLVLL